MKNQDKRRRRKVFFGNLKEYIKSSKAKRNFADRYYDTCDDGSVRIHVNGESGLFSPYGNELASDVIDYIEDSAYYVPIDHPLKINFSAVPEADRQNVRDCYKKHFSLELNDKCLDLKICHIKSIFLLIIGALFLAASFVIAKLMPGRVLISEILTVAASFSMWESIDAFLLERANIKTQKFDVGQLLLAEIEFETPEAPKK